MSDRWNVAARRFRFRELSIAPPRFFLPFFFLWVATTPLIIRLIVRVDSRNWDSDGRSGDFSRLLQDIEMNLFLSRPPPLARDNIFARHGASLQSVGKLIERKAKLVPALWFAFVPIRYVSLKIVLRVTLTLLVFGAIFQRIQPVFSRKFTCNLLFASLLQLFTMRTHGAGIIPLQRLRGSMVPLDRALRIPQTGGLPTQNPRLVILHAYRNIENRKLRAISCDSCVFRTCSGVVDDYDCVH